VVQDPELVQTKRSLCGTVDGLRRPVRIADVSRIQTEHLQNTHLERDAYIGPPPFSKVIPRSLLDAL
jgi:hypothetical protein